MGGYVDRRERESVCRVSPVEKKNDNPKDLKVMMDTKYVYLDLAFIHGSQFNK